MVTAAWWVRHQTKRLLRTVDDRRWNVVLAVSPDIDGMTTCVWPRRFVRWPQGPGNLGERMIRMMRRVRGPVCLIGADIPEVTSKILAEAFAALGNHDIIFGPATDGGYWLIGARLGSTMPMKALENVRWSTELALSDSRSALRGRRIGLVHTLSDVDYAKDLP